MRANGAIHAQAVRDAGARLVVFPELSLTGYELEAAPVDPQGAALDPLAQACGDAGSIALVGAPIAGPGDQDFIAMLAVNAAGAVVLYRKRWLGQEESIRFSPGDEPAVLEVDGWRIGVGICKDTGSPRARRTAGRVGDRRLLRRAGPLARRAGSTRGSRPCRSRCAVQAFVAFASFAGPTGGGYTRTAGSSGIWSPTGEALARAGTLAGEVALATLGSVVTRKLRKELLARQPEGSRDPSREEVPSAQVVPCGALRKFDAGRGPSWRVTPEWRRSSNLSGAPRPFPAG